jgi:hypothetical protein
MGCDIHSVVHVKRGGFWEIVTERLFPMDFPSSGQTHTISPFDWRSYGMFGFLADVRNYSHVPPISSPRGLPSDLQPRESLDRHSFSWLGLEELLTFNYDASFENRRSMRQEAHNYWNGAADSGPGNGKQTTFREFLGPAFFRDLEIMSALDPDPRNVRVVFSFDG